MSCNPFEEDIYWAAQKIKPQLTSKSRGFVESTIASSHIQAVEELDILSHRGREETREFPARYLVAFIVMNFLNILDDQCEIPQAPVTSRNLATYPIINEYCLEDLQSFLKESEDIKAVSPIKKTRITDMLSAQQRGIQMVTNTLNSGQISYTLEEALRYRLETLGNYFYLIAELGLIQAKTQKQYAQNLMAGQAKDDMRDAGQDLRSQVNPFVAVLAKHQLTSLLSQHPDFEDIVKSPNISLELSALLSEDMWKIKKTYSQI